jgi:hypothetical protein
MSAGVGVAPDLKLGTCSAKRRRYTKKNIKVVRSSQFLINRATDF